MNVFIGIQVACNRVKGALGLGQSKYMEATLGRLGMKHCNTSPTPAHRELCKPEKGVESDHEGHKRSQELVGCLLYSKNGGTRPDIVHAVMQITQYMACSGPTHFVAGKRF